MLPPMNKIERDELLRQIDRANAAYQTALDRDDDTMADRFEDERERLEAAYFKNLPQPVMGICPLCGRVLHRSFDPHGLDGPWWDSAAEPREPRTCPHFVILRGAVNFNGHKPLASDSEVLAGPEVPYVIPRILQMPGMIAVIGQVPMTPGYTAYPIAYFAPQRPPAESLTANWPRGIHRWKTQLGETGWRFPNDPWDFDLLPWLAQGKIRWWTPVDPPADPALATGTPDQYPWLKLPGHREMLIVQGTDLLPRGLPDGTEIQPMDLD